MENLSLVFSYAWSLSRKGAETFGGNARQYFREALRMAYKNFRRNVTAKDLVKIMLGRKLSVAQITEEVNARFKEQTTKNIARRVWNMFRSPCVDIEKIKSTDREPVFYLLKSVQEKFFLSGAATRALKAARKERAKAVKRRPAMSANEINACRLANAFHNILRTGVYVEPKLIEN